MRRRAPMLAPWLALLGIGLGTVLVLQQAEPVYPSDVAGKPVVGPALAAWAASPLGFWGAAFAFLLALRGLASVVWREPWFPAYFLLVGLALAVASYRWTNFDWAGLPFELEIADGGNAPLDQAVVGLVPLGLAILYNAWVQGARVEQDYLDRGALPEDARQARRMGVLAVGVLLLAAECTLLVGLVFQLTDQGRALEVPSAPSVFAFPFVAAALLVGLGWLARERARPARGAGGLRDDRQTS